ncbi:hypothetical protein [Alsobacter sp. R-9]
MGRLVRFAWTVVDYGRHAAGQVATSVIAALCVASITQTMMQRERTVPTAGALAAPAPVPAPAPAASGSLSSGPAWVPVGLGSPTAPPSPAFAVSGVVALPLPLEHAFPLDGEPVFQASLMRPFVALAGSAWSEAPVASDASESVARRKARTVVAEIAVPVVAPPVGAPAPAAASAGSLRTGDGGISDVLRPPGLIPASAAVAVQPHDAERRVFGIRLPSLPSMPTLPSVPEFLGGVAASAGSLTRFANLP